MGHFFGGAGESVSRRYSAFSADRTIAVLGSHFCTHAISAIAIHFCNHWAAA